MRNAPFRIWFPSCISALLQSDFKNRQCVTPSRKNKTLQKFAQSAFRQILTVFDVRESVLELFRWSRGKVVHIDFADILSKWIFLLFLHQIITD